MEKTEKTEEAVTAFKAKGRLLYLVRRGEPSTHYVPAVNWGRYLEARLNVPGLCRIFDTVDEAEQAALA